MPRIVVLGAAVCGLAAATMLACDGHDVVTLERDPAPVPDSPEVAWDRWERGGVGQFRQAHWMQARGRALLDAELPEVRDAPAAAGRVRVDPVARMPQTIADRAPRPGDERLATPTARRTTLEQVLGRAAEATRGLDVRRGVAVAGLSARAAAGTTHVTGVRTAAGERLPADLVVDAMGRRSALPALLAAAGAGAVAVAEEGAASGFLYYTRFFRSANGAPDLRAPLLTPFGSYSS